MGWLSGWARRVKLTADSGVIDADLVDFPALLYISGSSGKNTKDLTFVFDEVGANSKKIAVTKSDGTTQCYVEIEKWDSGNEKAWLWAKHPTLDADADEDYYLYFDNSQSDNTTYVGDPSDAVVHNVWDTNHKLVTHMRDDPDTSHVRDSTVNANDGTKKASGEPAVTTLGKIDDAQSFDGNDYIIIGDMGRPTYYTVEHWITRSGANALVSNSTIFNRSKDYSEWGIIALAGVIKAYTTNGVNTAQLAASTINTTDIPLDTLKHVVVTVDGSNFKFYLDGVLHDTVPQTVQMAGTGNYVSIGRYGNLSQVLWIGKIDEARVSYVARSTAWVKASYNSGNDSLWTWGDEEIGPIEITVSVSAAGLVSLGWKGEVRAEAKATDLLASKAEIYQSHIAEARATDLITLAQILHLYQTAEARATELVTLAQLLHVYKTAGAKATDVFSSSQTLQISQTAEARAEAILEPLEWIARLLAEAKATESAIPRQLLHLYQLAQAKAEAPPTYAWGFEQRAEVRATDFITLAQVLHVPAAAMAKATESIVPRQVLHFPTTAGAKATDLVFPSQMLRLYLLAETRATDLFSPSQILHTYQTAEAKAKDVLEPLEWIVPMIAEARAADLVTPRQVLHLYQLAGAKIDSLLEPLGWLTLLRAEARAEELITLRQVLHVPIVAEARATDLVSPSQLLHLYLPAGARATDLVAPGQLLHIYKTAEAKATDLFSLTQLLYLYPVAEAKARDVLEPLGWVVPLLTEVRATDIALPLQELLLYPTAEARAEAPLAYGWGFEQLAKAKSDSLLEPLGWIVPQLAEAKATDLVSPAQLLHLYLPAEAKATDLAAPSQLLHISKLADIVSSAPLALRQVLHIPVLAEARATDLFSLGFVELLTAAVKANAPVTLRQLLRAYLIAYAEADAAKTGKRMHPDKYMPAICHWYFDLDTGEVLPETFE